MVNSDSSGDAREEQTTGQDVHAPRRTVHTSPRGLFLADERTPGSASLQRSLVGLVTSHQHHQHRQHHRRCDSLPLPLKLICIDLLSPSCLPDLLPHPPLCPSGRPSHDGPLWSRFVGHYSGHQTSRLTPLVLGVVVAEERGLRAPPKLAFGTRQQSLWRHMQANAQTST
jgi:hypothetical protein